MMMTSRHAQLPVRPDAAQFQLETLERLPCGCVVAIHSVRPSGVTVVSLEAKGFHCTFATHLANKVIRLGGSFDPFGYEDGDDLSI
jgi:hypothetical protein